MNLISRITAGLFAATFAANLAFADGQGISKTEIVIGTIQDLSGPIAAFGKQARNGIQMRVDELNEKGGINGRKFKLVVEDNGYDPKKALLAAQKLVTNDEVFAILGHLGTAANMAAMPIQFEKNVINFFPLTGSRDMFEPPEKLKMAFSPPYFDQMRIVVPRLVKEKSAKRVCIVHQDDEYGLEVLRGTEAGLKAMKMTLTEKTSFKRGATDFSSQIAKLKAAECDFVVLGTIIRETVGAVGEARKNGFNPTFLGPTAIYTHLIHALGKESVEGVYGVHMVANPYIDDPHPLVREWAAKYKAKFGEDGTVFSVYGYTMMDIFAKAAEKAGANLTVDTFNNAMETTKFPPDMFGSPECAITKTDRLCNSKVRLAQIKGGRWVSISDYFAAE